MFWVTDGLMNFQAAWGGGVLLSKSTKGKMAGVERSKSITWNPHKLMGVTLQCSTLHLQEDVRVYLIFRPFGDDVWFSGPAGARGNTAVHEFSQFPRVLGNSVYSAYSAFRSIASSWALYLLFDLFNKRMQVYLFMHIGGNKWVYPFLLYPYYSYNENTKVYLAPTLFQTK